MQSGYGVPEIQQFMVDSTTCASLLSISHDMGNTASNPHKHHPQHHHHHHPQQQQQHQQQQPQQQQQTHQRFHPLTPIPITQQFFHHHTFHPFHQQQQQRRAVLHQQLGLDHDSGPDLFKLGVNESTSCGGARQALHDHHQENAVLRCEVGSESTRPPLHRWQAQDGEEESAIKEPFWKPLDIEYLNRNSKRCKEKLEFETAVSTKYNKKGEEGSTETVERKSSGSNYGLFSELEAIYTRSSGAAGGSGSALTGENNEPTTAAVGPAAPHSSFDHGSETSTGEEASLKINSNNSNFHKSTTTNRINIRSKRKRKHMNFFSSFFQSLVKQLMDHQESLHRKFLEVMERRDQERTEREEEWRRQEAAKENREAMARVQEQALASSREAAIISFLEKITGESIDLSSKTQFRIIDQDQRKKSPQHEIRSTDHHHHHRHQSVEINLGSTHIDNNKDDNYSTGNHPIVNIESSSTNSSRRWPKAEVQALIRVRSSLESRFQEPGLKAPLWEEVSSSMASLGYQRSSKRCKEKWENINKYFRKTKDSAKKRPQQSKTCPYFHQLDQLYSKNQNASCSSTMNRPSDVVPPKDHSELLDAIVVASDHNHPNPEDSSLGPLNLDFNGQDKEGANEATELNAGQVLLELQQAQAGNEEEAGDGEEDEQDAVEEGDQEEEGEEERESEENQNEHEEKDHRLQENMFLRVDS